MSFGFTRRFFGSVSKHPGDAGRNEDAFRWSSRRSAIALSDGASESFDSKLWAMILVRLFILKPAISLTRVDAAIAAFTHRHDPGSMSWSRQAAFDRGSFATLLGVAFDPRSAQAHVLAIGDTVAFLLDGSRMVASFPYTLPKDFARRPTLLSTRREHNSFLDRPDHARAASTVWRLDDLDQPRIVCMTDAIAEWFLGLARTDADAGEVLLGINDTVRFESLVTREREARRMKVDDSTMLVLE
jgi:hypothetical protein